MRSRRMRRLIWVYTVCLCPKNRMPSLYGLKFTKEVSYFTGYVQSIFSKQSQFLLPKIMMLFKEYTLFKPNKWKGDNGMLFALGYYFQSKCGRPSTGFTPTTCVLCKHYNQTTLLLQTVLIILSFRTDRSEQCRPRSDCSYDLIIGAVWSRSTLFVSLSTLTEQVRERELP